MGSSLEMSASDYDWALSIFFFGYVLFEIPSNLLLARSKPSIFIPTLIVVWGALCCLVATVKNFAGLMVLRFVLGSVEAGFSPGVLLLMSSWYTKAEQARRFAVYYSAAVASGAFGGLLAGAITGGLDGAAGIQGWRWLFIIEGLCTVVVGTGVYFFLFDFPENTKGRFSLLFLLFLPCTLTHIALCFNLTPPGFTDAEKRLLVERLRYDGQGDMVTDTDSVVATSPWKATLMAMRDWRVWGLVVIYSMIVGAGTISYYLPTLTATLGYDTVHAQYMTVPIYMVALVFCIVTAVSSDYFQDRKYHIAASSALGFATSVVAAVVLNSTVRYVMLCFMAAGIWSAVPIVLTWTGNTIQWPREKRAVAFALVNALGNLSSVYGSRIWPSWDSPGHTIGFGITAAFLGFAVMLTIGVGVLFHMYPHDSYVRKQIARATQGRENLAAA